MAADDYLTLRISAGDVRSGRYDSVAELLHILMDDEDTIREHEGKLLFDITELEESFAPDPALSPEVRAWFAGLDERWPALPYFFSRDPEQQQIVLFASMMVPFQMEGEAIRFNRQKLESFAIEKIQAVNRFCAEHAVDPREMIRQFCEHLHLEVIEEIVNQPSPYRFEPEVITSPFLQEFFETGYYFHTIDASDEAVLYALVDDPAAAYEADTALSIELFRAEEYPVISMELTVYDVPENPLKMTFVYNVDLERHRAELYAYAEMSFLMCNFLFRENGVLYYGFCRPIDLSDALRQQIRSLVLDAGNLLRAIPKEARNFTRAVEKLFIARAEQAGLSPVLAEEPQPGDEPDPEGGAPLLPPAATPDSGSPAGEDDWRMDGPDEAGEEARPEESRPRADASAASQAGRNKPSFSLTPPPQGPNKGKGSRKSGEAVEILEEYSLVSRDEETAEPPEPSAQAPRMAADPSGSEDQRRVLRSPYDTTIPTSVLPESIQRITKALSKPMRRGGANVSEELAIAPAPKKVVTRNEDPVERLSRRLLIMQNNAERIERENIRLRQELRASHEEIERLQRENMALESRWWRFWK